MTNPASINNILTPKRNFNYSPKIGGGGEERCKAGETIRKLLKNQYFCAFNRILRLEEGFCNSEICDWEYSNAPETICKKCLSKTWKLWHLPVLSLFCYLPLLKCGTPTLTKYTLLKLVRQELSSHTVLICYR